MKALKDKSKQSKRMFFHLLFIPYLSGTIVLALDKRMNTSDPVVFSFHWLAFAACTLSIVVLALQTMRDALSESQEKAGILFLSGLIVPLMLFRFATASDHFLPMWGEYVKAAIASTLLFAYIRWVRKTSPAASLPPEARVIT